VPPPVDPTNIILPVAISVGAVAVLLIGALLVFWYYKRRLPFAVKPLLEEPAEMAPAAANSAQDASAGNDKSAEQSDADRRRLRERITRLTADDRALQAQLNTIENLETAEAAEAAVAAAGSPDAALLAAVSRAATPGEVRALLRRGANPDAAFLDRGTLAVAARSCAPGVVKVLIDAGATLDMKDGRGWTPLMHAIDAHNTHNSRECAAAPAAVAATTCCWPLPCRRCRGAAAVALPRRGRLSHRVPPEVTACGAPSVWARLGSSVARLLPPILTTPGP
jgi:hypothetical protein